MSVAVTVAVNRGDRRDRREAVTLTAPGSACDWARCADRRPAAPACGRTRILTGIYEHADPSRCTRPLAEAFALCEPGHSSPRLFDEDYERRIARRCSSDDHHLGELIDESTLARARTGVFMVTDPPTVTVARIVTSNGPLPGFTPANVNTGRSN